MTKPVTTAREDADRLVGAAATLIKDELEKLERSRGRWYAIEVLILMNEMKHDPSNSVDKITKDMIHEA